MAQTSKNDLARGKYTLSRIARYLIYLCPQPLSSRLLLYHADNEEEIVILDKIKQTAIDLDCHVSQSAG